MPDSDFGLDSRTLYAAKNNVPTAKQLPANLISNVLRFRLKLHICIAALAYLTDQVNMNFRLPLLEVQASRQSSSLVMSDPTAEVLDVPA